MDSETEIQIATRISKSLHAKLLERQKEVKKLTGFEPSISAVVRLLLEEAFEPKKGKRS